LASDRSKQQPSPYWTAVPLTRICTTDTYPHDRHGFTRPTPIHTTDTDLHDRPVFTRIENGAVTLLRRLLVKPVASELPAK